jgi:exosortase/archaeosortase family protein
MKTDSATGKRSVKFVALFLFYLTGFLLLLHSPLAFYDKLRAFTAYTAFRFWKLFSLPVVQDGPFITFYDFPMEITSECMALHYLAIFSAGVLAAREHTRKYRFAGIMIGAIAVLLLNVVRIGMLGMVGHYARDSFDLVHVYLWQGAFALLVLLAWSLWVNKRLRITAGAVRSVILALVASLLCLWGLHELVEYYAIVVARAANAAAGVLSAVITADVAIVSAGTVIESRTPFGTLHNDIYYEAINVVVLAALAARSLYIVRPALLLKRTAASALALSLQHLSFIVAYGMLFAHGSDRETLTIVLWVGRGFSMAAPMLVWVLASRFWPDEAG